MNKKALVQQAQAATLEEQKLVERVLASSAAIKPALVEALSKINESTARSRFLQYVLETALAVSREAKVTDADWDEHQQRLETMVEVFTRPEALKALAPADPLAAARFKGVQLTLLSLKA